MPGLKGRELLELGRVVLEVAVEFVGVEIEIAVIALKSAIEAAVVSVANAKEGRRIGHRQGLHQNRVHQREDGNVRADPERDGQDHGRGKARRLAELAEGKFEIVHRGWT